MSGPAGGTVTAAGNAGETGRRAGSRACTSFRAQYGAEDSKQGQRSMTIDKQFLHILHILTFWADPTEDIFYFADRAARADVPGRIERARVRRGR